MAALGPSSTMQPVTLVPSPPFPVTTASSQPTAVAPPEPTIPYSWREKHPNAQLVYIRDHQEANRALERLDDGVYGLDLEWKPTFAKGQAENPVALVQIANYRTILLLQVTAMREFPSKLREFLVNPNFAKAGVGIQGDTKKLYQDWQVDIRNCVDLALLARTVDNDKWKGRYTDPLGLARLVATYENRVLAKGKITRSNWERILTEPQQMYAANDAHAGYVIYTRLMSMMPSLPTQPHVKCYTFGSIRGCLYDPSGAIWRAFNPNYDPGPLPAPREPKPPKKRDLGTNTTADKPDHITPAAMTPFAGRGPGNASALPVPRSTPNFQGPSVNRGNGRGSRGNNLQRQRPHKGNSRHSHPNDDTPRRFEASSRARTRPTQAWPSQSFEETNPFSTYPYPQSSGDSSRRERSHS